MANGEYGYLSLARRILENGSYREGRNGGTYSLFDGELRFYMSDGFPLLTTKRLPFRSIVAELLWFLSGSTNKFDLQKMGCTIWDEWGDDQTGELGPIYGEQWRAWDAYLYDERFEENRIKSIDQIAILIDGLKNDPYSRRHIVNAWNVGDLPFMALPPCHVMFQCHVADGKLSLKMYQRSADWFLGVPFNIASYALLLHLLARECGYKPDKLAISFGDMHIYANHVQQIKEQVVRNPTNFPNLYIGSGGIFDLTPEMISVGGYMPHPAIKGEVSR